jgi:hypothetical protein
MLLAVLRNSLGCGSTEREAHNKKTITGNCVACELSFYMYSMKRIVLGKTTLGITYSIMTQLTS